MTVPASPPPSALTDPAALDALAEALVDQAMKAGADAADVVAARSESLSVSARGGALEEAEREETLDFGLRVFLDAPEGKREAHVSASDPKPDTLKALAERAVAMAREAPASAEAGPAAADQLAGALPDLALSDGETPSPETLLEAALALEAAALAVSGVTQAESAGVGWRRGRIALAGSNGLRAAYDSGSHSASVSAVAGDGAGGMERDYAFTSARRRADLKALAEIGREAGERAVKRVGPRKPKTGAYPVVFEPRVAAGLVGALLSAMNGAGVARGSSFLKDRMGAPLLPAELSIIDDPLLQHGLGSRPIDGDGLPVARKTLVQNGVLSAWLLDLVSARKLGLASNGSAARGTGGGPSPAASNAWLEGGAGSAADLIREIEAGLFVTEMMGAGLNPVTGDYSRGAAGFWIENGQIAYPVSELTVAGHIDDMLKGLRAADDLVLDRRIAAPTLRIEGLTIAAD